MVFFISQFNFGHKLLSDDAEHFVKLGHILGGETLFDALDNLQLIVVHKINIVIILIGQLQVILSPVGGGVEPFKIALFDKAVDLVGGVGLGDAQKFGKLAHRGLAQQINDLKRKGLHCGKGAVPLTHQIKNAAIKL